MTTTIGVDTAYSSAYFRRPASYAGEAAIFIVGPPPHFLKRGYVATIENERLLVSLIGRFVHPPTDEPGFLAFAHSLHSPFLYELIQQTERLTAIAHHRFPSSVQRHYERMPAFPEGFLVLGDALCCFNPVYGQGMSAAALQAKVLHEVLAERSAWSRELAGIAAEFFPRAADINRAPWVLAANLDFAYPQTRGERPGGMEQQGRYLAALDQLQVEDVEVQRLVMEVFQLTRPLAALQEEPLRSRVLARLEG